MKKEKDFVSLITKLTKDIDVEKRQCFKFGSKQLTVKLLKLMENIKEEIERSINLIYEEMKNTNCKYLDLLWRNKVEKMLESEKYFSEKDYLKFIRVNCRDLERLIREYARKKLVYSDSLEIIIGLLPEYAGTTPNFPLHLAFLGIITSEEDFFCDEKIPALIAYYKEKLNKLLDEKQYMDEIFRAKLELFIVVQKKSLEEVQKYYSFLLVNSIDDVSIIKYFSKFCKRGYLNSLD